MGQWGRSRAPTMPVTAAALSDPDRTCAMTSTQRHAPPTCRQTSRRAPDRHLHGVPRPVPGDRRGPHDRLRAARLRRDYPLDVIPTTTAEGLAALEQGTVDVALVRDPTPRESVVIERLATDPIMVALPADHPLAGDDTLALSQLRGQPRVGWARAGALDYHDRITALLRRKGVDPTPAYELRGVDTRLGAVASGLGWALESAARAAAGAPTD
jgi:DNA-binding transcriptional LysR family regulator